MLNSKLSDGGVKPTEQELQDIAKAMYGELLADLCTDQRVTPAFANHHSAANRAFAEYFQRLVDKGGHCSLLPAEECELSGKGWDAQRLADFRHIIALREEKGFSPIQREAIDIHLARRGFEPDDELRWMVELALYPAYRDAYRARARFQPDRAECRRDCWQSHGSRRGDAPHRRERRARHRAVSHRLPSASNAWR